ncbi:MAG: NAD(P)-dependent alcohol dehydrogenase [Actinobacteria bacterium]|nr:NAD(P)-dependent alcohol dehydrogenase [Actinomycetota bacterium]
MKAIVNHEYGAPDDLKLQEIDKPGVGEDSVLVRVRAASVNPYDWHVLRGLPYFVRLTEGLRRPKHPIRGVDVAGLVEAVGEKVTAFQPGDEVFGGRSGAFAEYVCGVERNFTTKPAGLSFEQAAAIPMAGCTALQALREAGRLELGQSVLINGAAGGVGTFAVQIAKAMGGRVTGVCSTPNIELVKSIGADEVIDYTVDDFTRGNRQYDLILQLAGNQSLSGLRCALRRHGTLVLVGGGNDGNLLGPLATPVRAFILSRFVSQRLLPFLAKLRTKDMDYLTELVVAGKVTPVIGRTYSLSEVPEAIRYVQTGHSHGKTVITV